MNSYFNNPLYKLEYTNSKLSEGVKKQMIKVVRVLGEDKVREESLLSQKKQTPKQPLDNRLLRCNLRPWFMKKSW